MSKYLCENCKWNNNGWCKQKQMNGLKKKNILECDSYKAEGTELYISKSKDAFDVPHLIIKINNEEVFIPTSIITDFVKGTGNNISTTIPD
ncbi:hypothetical protein [Clostridium sp.]|uniref:hypothetical protein n=1 Tax=Clostridium sp. TaxID=1506 RepID=UPI002620AF96|nr:hypothetical protein [Clostridium sp.]